MEELISRIVNNVGIDEELAKTSVNLILKFLDEEGPQDRIGGMIDALPGARDMMANASEGGGGLLAAAAGMMGGGAMALMGQLTGAGLGMGDVQGVAAEVIGFAKEHAGEEMVTEVLGAIPGLGQFV